MKLHCALAMILAVVIGSSVSAGSPGNAEVADARSSFPAVSWDRHSLVDLNLDGRQTGSALIGYSEGKVFVAIFRGLASSQSKARVLEFGVGAGQQAALCEVPATLKVEELQCKPTGENSLPGCRHMPGAKHLIVQGGDCDPIVIYWNHKTQGPSWWRL